MSQLVSMYTYKNVHCLDGRAELFFCQKRDLNVIILQIFTVLAIMMFKVSLKFPALIYVVL